MAQDNCAAEIIAGIVGRVIVIPDNQVSRVQAYCAIDLRHGGAWEHTRPDGSVRKNYAGPGHTFDAGRDAFVAPKPERGGIVFESWQLDEATARWKAPKDYPSDGKEHRWDEAARDWKPINGIEPRS